jgi:hypothetical protein
VAINLNPPNFSGTASIAGRGINNTALTNAGALGLQAYQLRQAEEEAKKQRIMEMMRMRSQESMARGQLGIQQGELGLRQQELQQRGLLANMDQDMFRQELGMKDQHFQIGRQDDAAKLAAEMASRERGFGLDERKLGLIEEENKMKMAMEYQKLELKKMLEEKKEVREEKAAYAMYGLRAMQGAKTPEEAQQIRTEILKEALDKGYISKEEAKAGSKMPLFQFSASLEYKMALGKKVKEFADLMKANKEDSKEGTQITIGADGSVNYSQSPTKAVVTEVQKDLKNKELAMDQLKKIEGGYDPSYFTYRGQASVGTSQFAEKSEGTPLLESAAEGIASAVSGKSKEDRAKFIEQRSAYMNNVDQLFNAYKKEITGAAAGEKELELIRDSFLNGQMSPSQFTGALKQVVDKYKSEAEYNRNILNKGVNTTSPDDMFNYYRNNPKYKDWSDEKIRRAMQQ